MKEITSYQCEICGNIYDNKSHALRCEDRALPKTYPVGMIYMNDPDGPYGDVIFSVARNNIYGHDNHIWSWASADNGSGDHFGCDYIRHAETKIGCSNIKPNTELPAFKRMVEYLKSRRIEPCVWDGKKIEWL